MKTAAAALAAALIALSAFGQARLPDLKGRTIRAVTENSFVPLNFIDPRTGKPAGWEYDAVNEIGRRLNAKIVWGTASWDTIIPAVQDGRFDVGVDGFSITAERKKKVAFSDPYMVSRQVMLARGAESRFASAAELGANPKLLIGSQAGGTSFSVALYNVLDGKEDNPRLRPYDSVGAAVTALLGGEVDCVLVESPTGSGFVRDNPGKLKIVGDELGTDPYGFIFRQGSDLVAPFNAGITALKADGTLDRLTAKWFYEYSTR